MKKSARKQLQECLDAAWRNLEVATRGEGNQTVIEALENLVELLDEWKPGAGLSLLESIAREIRLKRGEQKMLYEGQLIFSERTRRQKRKDNLLLLAKNPIAGVN